MYSISPANFELVSILYSCCIYYVYTYVSVVQ